MNNHQLLKKYFNDQSQTGRGGSVYFKGSRLQRGSGLGSLLGNFIKSPLVKKGLSYVAKTGLSTAGDIVQNLIQGKTLKQSAKKGLSKQYEIQKTKAIKKLKRTVAPPPPQQMFIKRKRKQSKRKQKNKKIKNKRYRRDNFSRL